ncbi:MAG: hypothetical protein ABI651_05390 [Verrucomicrobiota bacterium]
MSSTTGTDADPDVLLIVGSTHGPCGANISIASSFTRPTRRAVSFEAPSGACNQLVARFP